MNKVTLAIIAALSASIALAEDFKTIDGKEYKNAKVSRVEPDGIVITFSGGIVADVPPELQPDFQRLYGQDHLPSARCVFDVLDADDAQAFREKLRRAVLDLVAGRKVPKQKGRG